MRKQIITVLIASSMGLGATAFAQQAGSSTPGQNSPAASTAPAESSMQNFKNSDLEKFAEVQKPLDEIRSEYSQRVQSTQEPEKAAKLQQEASDKMMEVVKSSGLEVETYNQIAMAVQSDPELQAKVQSMMN
jgi:inosine-uridine nucleoside N-ribohydrolase